MATKRAKIVYGLGLTHSENGAPLPIYALQVFAKTQRVRNLVLAPKIHVYRWLLQREGPEAVAHYYGVPPRQYRSLLLALKPERILLFGDLDPFDVATWLHLRRLLRGKVDIQYNWSTDGERLLEQLGQERMDRCCIPMAGGELAWWREHRKRLPELDALFQRLGKGKKLEMDALATLDDESVLANHFEMARGANRDGS